MTLHRTALALAGALALSACMTVRIDESVVFQPPSARGAHMVADMTIKDEESLAPARVTHGFLGAGEERIAYTLVERGSAGPLIAICMGNANDRRGDGVTYARRGLPYGDVLMFDYPGYGDSGGKPSEASMVSMLARVGDFAVERAGDRPLVLWGHSLGGFVCSQMAGRLGDKTAGLVIEASALNVEEVARSWTPWYARPFARLNVLPSLMAYDSGEALKDYKQPVIVLGAEKDLTLKVKLARSLAETLKTKGVDVTYAEFPDAQHGDIPSAKAYRHVMDAWFADLAKD